MTRYSIYKVLLLIFAFTASIPAAFAQTNCIPCDRPSSAGLLPVMNGQPGDFAVRRAGLEVDAKWKIPVSQDGWYRLTQAQLVTAGMPTNQLIGSQLRMYCRTQEVAILVTTSNVMASQDAVYFYGIKHDGEYSRTNVYWLGLGGEGRRIGAISGAPLGGENLVTSACFSAVYDNHNLHRPYHMPLNTDIDHWFAALVNTSAFTSVDLNTTNRVLGETANLQISMFGLTENVVSPDHRTRIQINGTLLAQPTYDDTVLLSTNFYFDSANIVSNVSTIQLIQNAPGVGNESAYLISLRLDYVARIFMRSPHQEFCGRPGTNVYRVRDLTTTQGYTVLDITDPYAPVMIINGYFTNIIGNTNSFLVDFRYATNQISRFAVVQSNGVINAATPTEVNFRNLGDVSRQADYLMITPYSLRQHAYRLAKHRYTNGLEIAVAPLPDIYDEFGYGIVDADSIKQFIGYTYHHWMTPRPRFALLVGEGTYDPLGSAGSVPAVNVPTRFGPTPFVVAAMDTWYGLVDGVTNGSDDFLPDVVVGRMSVSSNSALSNVVNKVIAFDNGAFATNALLVTDANAGINFKASSDANIYPYLFTNGYGIQLVTVPPSVQASVVAAINAGRRLVTYVGHGALDRWSSVNLLNTTNLANLSNTVYPLVTIFSCQNGSFVERETNCLSEAFIEVPRGASAVFSPTALSTQTNSDFVANGFMHSLASQKRKYLGDVAFNSYLNLWAFNSSAAELRTYQILGDPGLIVNRPGTLP